MRIAAQSMYQELIDAEAEGAIGAGFWERAEGRTAIRNESRARRLSKTAGDLELRIPKLRPGSFFPCLLERRMRIDQALFAVIIMEAYLHGVSTWKVDDLVKALGADTGISKSEVSRICKDLDEELRRVPRPQSCGHDVSLRFPRRDLLQGPRQPPGRLAGHRRGHGRDCRRPPRGPGDGRRGQ